jgi:hypothetical protein
MIALAIVTLSFPADQAADALIAPLLDGVVVVPCNAVVSHCARATRARWT